MRVLTMSPKEDNQNSQNSILSLSQMLHNERNINTALKRTISAAKINLFQERLRVQQFQILNQKLIRQHKNDITRIDALLVKVGKEKFHDTDININNANIDIIHYENLIKVLQDQVEILLNERDAYDCNYMKDFVECQSHIKIINNHLVKMDLCHKEVLEELQENVKVTKTLSEENKALLKVQQSTINNKHSNEITKSKNIFLKRENNFYKTQLKIMQDTIDQLKSQRIYLYKRLREMKKKEANDTEINNNKIYRLSKEICSMRYKSGLKCKDFGTKSKECICDNLQIKS